MEELNYQRRRDQERGVDYDDYGAEMEPNARVWGVYVDETDKADKELVDGWNNSMDVMLIFAALYSAILTAFVIESSNDLKQDYSEISARTLITISNTLLSPATSSPGTSQMDLPNFIPTTAAVMVNTLWFLSLGLSVAVSLIAILAKEWCYSFMTRRTGAKLTQGRLRQKRWDGIRYWKMEEIICLLPLLMHIALLLFAIGLAIYLWNINPSVSLPVVLTTILTVLYYTVTAFLPLFFKYCPYTTAVVKLFHPLWTAIFDSIYCRALFELLIMTPAWLLLRTLDFKDRVSGKIRSRDNDVENDAHSAVSVDSRNTLHARIQEFQRKFYNRIEKMHKDFLIDRSQFSEDETPMDKATSAMLLWMITNCEDPKSVDLALQALAGADLWLPVKSFFRHEIDLQVLRKLERCLYVLESPHLKNDGTSWEDLLDNAHLYSRALATLLRGAPENPQTAGVTWNEWEHCMRRLHKILNVNTNLSGQGRISQSTDFEFGTLLLEGSRMTQPHSPDEFYAKRRDRQWQILEQITTNQATGIPPNASSVRALVNVITRTLLYAPRSPLPLVDIFNAYNNAPGNEDETLAHSIGIALTIARFVNARYAPVPMEVDAQPTSSHSPIPDHSHITALRHEHAQKVYKKLSTKQPTSRRTRALLTFGLLGLLDYPADESYLAQDEIQSIDKALRTLETSQPQSHKSTLLTREDQPLRYLGYHKVMPLTPPKFDLENQFETIVMRWLGFWIGTNSETDAKSPDQDVVTMYLEALLSPSRCQLFGNMIVDHLTTLIMPSKDSQPMTQDDDRQRHALFSKLDLGLRAKKLCIRSITYSVTDWPRSSRYQKQELNAIINKLNVPDLRAGMVSLIENHEQDRELVPYAMRFIWNFTATRNSHSLPRESRDNRARALPENDQHRVRSMSRVTGAGWGCVRNGEYEALWFGLLRELCDENYQNVLESGILADLAKPCEDKCYQATSRRPTPANLSLLGLPASNEEGPTTWPGIYKHLQKTCEGKRERERKEREKGQEEHETTTQSKQPLTIETRWRQASVDRPELASPRSEPEQPIASGSRRPSVPGV